MDLQGLSVFLIGMMGTGKTTVGQLLAQALHYRFFDTDVLIEKVAKKTINQIFAQEGEVYFRDLESQVLDQLCAYNKSTIATGGGIILKQQNWSYLQQGLIIWLDAPVELLVQRLEEDQTRPLLQQQNLREKLTQLISERRSRYAQADLHILIKPQDTPSTIVNNILQQIPTVLRKKEG